ncbi:hypothetical protein OG763_20370 [Streptomyces sp. NBC_01230]|uniref:hypothetical protein n=1 Tax=unclassified Streptomyces TaxID=2593676 RepID=UPI002E11BBF7|nr:hypothetical protein OG763_20370 [Streptomyces sp. NBC_01230]
MVAKKPAYVENWEKLRRLLTATAKRVVAGGPDEGFSQLRVEDAGAADPYHGGRRGRAECRA